MRFSLELPRGGGDHEFQSGPAKAGAAAGQGRAAKEWVREPEGQPVLLSGIWPTEIHLQKTQHVILSNPVYVEMMT
jgi:hypothetical protein